MLLLASIHQRTTFSPPRPSLKNPVALAFSSRRFWFCYLVLHSIGTTVLAAQLTKHTINAAFSTPFKTRIQTPRACASLPFGKRSLGSSAGSWRYGRSEGFSGLSKTPQAFVPYFPGSASSSRVGSDRVAVRMSASSSSPSISGNKREVPQANTKEMNDEKSTFQVSPQIHQTLTPCVVLMKEIMAQYASFWQSKGGIYSLAQGIVYWRPPPSVATTLTSRLEKDNENDLHLYGSVEGIPALITALEQKLSQENNLDNVSVMVTAGANQAFVNCVLTLLGDNQRCVVFRPYYFNHVMAVQMARGEEGLLVGPCTNSENEGGDDGGGLFGCLPDVQWLREQLEAQDQQDTSKEKQKLGRINMVTVVNPCNPTGVTLPSTLMEEITELCAKHKVWLVVDNTYEHFVHASASSTSSQPSPSTHFPCMNQPHVIHIFSFSKAFSLAGYRVGYLTISNQTSYSQEAYEQMVKVQDTLPICVSRTSQTAALAAMSAGRSWVLDKVETLEEGRRLVMESLAPLGKENIVGGSGAMYVMAKLPSFVGDEDVEVCRRWVEKHGVAVIPGTFCGFPGWIRVCYSNLEPKECRLAALRLKEGVDELMRNDGGNA